MAIAVDFLMKLLANFMQLLKSHNHSHREFQFQTSPLDPVNFTFTHKTCALTYHTKLVHVTCEMFLTRAIIHN